MGRGKMKGDRPVFVADFKHKTGEPMGKKITRCAQCNGAADRAMCKTCLSHWIQAVGLMHAGVCPREIVQPDKPLKMAEQVVAAHRKMQDAAEMLWVVLANVSGGNWALQSDEWRAAAEKWRDNYFAAMPPPPPAKPTSVEEKPGAQG